MDHLCLACDPNLPGTKFCQNFGTYFTYYTDEYTDEQVYILEEMKKIAMGAYDFEEIYDQRCEYKSEVVKYLESRLRSLTSPSSREYQTEACTNKFT